MVFDVNGELPFLDAKIMHELRGRNGKPFGPAELVRDEEQPQVHGLFLRVQNARALLAEGFELVDKFHGRTFSLFESIELADPLVDLDGFEVVLCEKFRFRHGV